MATPHIESKKEDIAKIVLMPGDPLRAEMIAKNYLENYRVVNFIRERKLLFFLLEWEFLVWEFILMNYSSFMMLNKLLE